MDPPLHKAAAGQRGGRQYTEADVSAFFPVKKSFSPPPAPTPLPKARGEIEGGRYVIADGMIGVFGEGAVFDETEDEIP